MTVNRQAATRHALTALLSGLLGYVTQGVQTAIQVRDELRDTRREVAELRDDVNDIRCDIAIFTKSTKLPRGCVIITQGKTVGK